MIENIQSGDVFIGGINKANLKVLKVDEKSGKVEYLDLQKNTKHIYGLAAFKRCYLTRA